jgi:Zn2+/Cd2+-exporting ATPase
MHCVIGRTTSVKSAAAARRLERRLARRLPGADVAFARVGLVRIRFDPRQYDDRGIATLLQSLGVTVDLTRIQPCGRPQELATGAGGGWRKAWRWLASSPELMLVLVGGLLWAGGLTVHLADGPLWLRLTLLGLSAACTSTRTFPSAVQALRHLQLDIDVLMFLAAAGAAMLGHYEEGAFLLLLFGLGNAGEHMALAQAKRAIQALAAVAPDQARLLQEDGSDRTVPVEQVAVGDRVLVRPFEQVPVDAVIEAGESHVNQAPITGESAAVHKQVGSEVFAGSINGEGRLVVVATRLAGESTLARVIRLVEEAQANKSPTQLFTDRIERFYVPVVLVATIVLVVLPPILGGGAAQLWATWFYRGMAFLTAASPCALAIGTPAAILCGVARAAQVGVLIKGGAFLEAVSRTQAVAFDKTGTLTQGQLAVQQIVTEPGLQPQQALALAASVESQVNHPLAQAIVREAHRQAAVLESVCEVRQTAGVGAAALLNGQQIAVGKPEAVAAAISPALADAVTEIRSRGSTAVGVSRDGTLVAVLGLNDQLRPEAEQVLAELRALGVEHIAMLTGDHQAAAMAIAGHLPLDAIHAQLLPQDKMTLIEQMSRQHRVMMVGDGINDAPALARASVGVAMGAAGADVAMETADVVLMGSHLSHLPRLMRLSRYSRRIIQQNLLLALGTIAIVSPLAAAGYASLAVAVLLHEGSTVLVVLNALRLLRFERGPSAVASQCAECDLCEHCPQPMMEPAPR